MASDLNAESYKNNSKLFNSHVGKMPKKATHTDPKASSLNTH
jgi:hypothetical protein